MIVAQFWRMLNTDFVKLSRQKIGRIFWQTRDVFYHGNVEPRRLLITQTKPKVVRHEIFKGINLDHPVRILLRLDHLNGQWLPRTPNEKRGAFQEQKRTGQ